MISMISIPYSNSGLFDFLFSLSTIPRKKAKFQTSEEEENNGYVRLVYSWIVFKRLYYHWVVATYKKVC